jgi:nitrate/nitrite transport system ATP-binding protein
LGLLEIDSLCLSYGARRVLDRISFNVEEGECLVLLGRTGSGKTTLLSLLAGLLAPSAGSIRLNGRVVTGPGLDRGVVFQHDSLLPWLTAEGNVALAVEAAFPDEAPDDRARRVSAALALVKLETAAHHRPATALSGGMRQRVSIALAFAMEPMVLLMDEPFSAVDALTRAGLQTELARIHRDTGRTIVIVTSDLDEALLLADRIFVLREDGGLFDPFRLPRGLTRDRVASGFEELRARLRRLLETPGDVTPSPWPNLTLCGRVDGEILLELEGVTKRFSANADSAPAVEEIGFVLREREFLSILGHSGCGKSTILSMVAGLIRPSAGAIRIGGAPTTEPGADRAMVFQSPALLPWLSVEDNVRLGVDQAFADQPKSERRRIVAEALDRLDLGEFSARMPHTLSAGARQRVGVARAIALKPRLLLLDEPFSSLDTPTREGLQSVLARLCFETGTAAILVTHDINEALALSDRIALMTNGPRARIGKILNVAGSEPLRLRGEILRFLEETAHTPSAGATEQRN